MSVTGWFRAVRDYFSGATPALATANAVALAVVGNQPFYPAHVWWIAPQAGLPAMLTWLSTPAFAAVPPIGRRDARLGKTLLILAGIANTALCTAILGRACGVELFYIPCALLPLVLLTGYQRVIAFACLATAILALVAVLPPRGFVALSEAENASLWRLHAISVGCLLALMGYRAWVSRRARYAAP